MNTNYKSVEVVGWNKKTLDLKKDNLKSICQKIPDDIPIAILNVSGEFRTGKSTLLNLIVSILNKYEKNNEVNQINVGDLKLNCGCLNEGRNDRSGFGWRAGNEPCTRGIRMLDHHFVIPNPKNKSQKMAVLLVDAEGLEASDSTNGSDQVLFGISNLMSSVLILNQKGIIGPNDLTYLRLLTEFCPPEKGKTNGAFCGIELLMRDFKYKTRKLSEQLKEIADFKKKLFNAREEGLKNNLEVINVFYRYVDCFGLPQPGNEIECEDFKGNMDEFSEEFKDILLHYILDILTRKLYPTYENKESLYCLCESLNAFIQKGIPQLGEMHRIFLDNKNMMVMKKMMTELINPLKEKFEDKNIRAQELMKECDKALKKANDYGKELSGTEEMIKEKMDYVNGQLKLLRKECEQRETHEKDMETYEKEKNATEEQMKEIERTRLECQKNNERLSNEIQKLTITLATRKPQEIHIHERGPCVIQ